MSLILNTKLAIALIYFSAKPRLGRHEQCIHHFIADLSRLIYAQYRLPFTLFFFFFFGIVLIPLKKGKQIQNRRLPRTKGSAQGD